MTRLLLSSCLVFSALTLTISGCTSPETATRPSETAEASAAKGAAPVTEPVHSEETVKKQATTKTDSQAKPKDKIKAKTAKKGKKMFATLETSMGNIKIELFADKSPKTVENFVGLAKGTKEWTDPKTNKKVKRPLYDGTTFHRVISGFMIQGGDPLGTGTGGPGYVFDNETHPELKHDKAGVVAMANAGPNTNGCQFYITVAPQPYLDGGYTIFGQVVDGMDVVTKISKVKTGPGDKPVEAVTIKSVKIE
jgi:peptidyl-prolyl cis-trans isomerase A (cyclophilin A)